MLQPATVDPIAGFAHYLDRERQVSPRTTEVYLYWLRRWDEWARENSTSFLAPHPRDIRTFSTSADWSRKTRSQLLSALKSFYSYCELEEIVLRSPARSVPHPRMFSRRGPRYDRHEARRLMAVAVDLTDVLIVRLGLYAGVRTGEGLGLRIGDVSLREGTITICRSGPDSDTTKGRRDRTIPLHPELREPLRRALRVRDDRLIDLETTVGYRTRFKRLCSRAGVPYHGPHALRRSFSTRLGQMGVREGVIRELLGHVMRVEDLYIEVTRPELRRAIRDLSY